MHEFFILLPKKRQQGHDFGGMTRVARILISPLPNITKRSVLLTFPAKVEINIHEY